MGIQDVSNASINNNVLTSNKVSSKKSKLERTPMKDDVSFTGKDKKEPAEKNTFSLKEAENLKYDLEYNKVSKWKNEYKVTGDNIDLELRHKFSSSTLKGSAYNKDLDLEFCNNGFNPNNMKLKGKIDGKEISLDCEINEKNINISGDLKDIDEETLNLLNIIAIDHAKSAKENLMFMTVLFLTN